MPKTRTLYFCTDCGNETARWEGQCPACDAWNTLAEEPAGTGGARRRSSAGSAAAGRPAPVRLVDVDGGDAVRWTVGIGEFDFVLGGGIVPGSLVLIGGEPGIGKSTLLLQVAARLEAGGRAVLYASGEESASQVRLRAARIGTAAGQVAFLAETSLGLILAAAARAGPPAVLIVDSIQAVRSDETDASAGSVTQVRECAARLQRFAKESGTAVFLVGHVTKGGEVAGPKTLEHMVDTVLYFEGESGLEHRVLRATKNRFGGIDEIGVFRMAPTGLEPVANPSALFLADRVGEAGATGAVVATIEGSRPLLVEVQALCARASYGAPQRVATGFDRQRLAVLLAVLETRAGVPAGECDVFVKVAGGARLVEPAADLAVAAAVAAGVAGRSLPADAVFLGEIGLAGELRAPGQVERRLVEAARMGFRRAMLPRRAVPDRVPPDLEPVPLDTVRELVQRCVT